MQYLRLIYWLCVSKGALYEYILDDAETIYTRSKLVLAVNESADIILFFGPGFPQLRKLI